MKNEKGFTLIEVTIVAGLMAMVGLYMMQMTNNLNKSISRMETKADEQELMYITTLALTDKLACQRTLGSYCEDDDEKAAKDTDGNYIYQQNRCQPSNDHTWKSNEFEIKEWSSSEDFNVRNINSSNSIDIAREMESNALISSNVAKIFNRNFGVVFKACRVDIKKIGSSSSLLEEMPLNLIDQAYAVDGYGVGKVPLKIPDCDESLYFVGQSLLMKKFFVAN